MSMTIIERILCEKQDTGCVRSYKKAGSRLCFCINVLVLFMAACEPNPVINGSRNVTVGQEILVSVEQGPVFRRDDLELKDALGNVYRHSSPELNYRFESEKEIVFTVPFGVATGPASLYLGAEGRSKGYTIDLQVVRLAALLNEHGDIHVIDMSTGQSISVTKIGDGAVTARLAADGNRIIATSQQDGAVHFLSFDGDGLRPYAPAIERVGTTLVDAVLIPGGALLAVDQGLAVIKQLNHNATFLEEFLDVPPLRGLAGGEGHERVLALAAPTIDATDVGNEIYIVDLEEHGPELRDQVLDIGGTTGGAGHMVLSRDGSHLYVANRADDTITHVNITSTDASVSAIVSLPLEQLDENKQVQHADPVRVRLTPSGSDLIVLCGRSKSLVRFGVGQNGSLEEKETVLFNGLPFDVSFVADMAYVIVDNDVKKINLADSRPVPENVEWENTAAALTIMLQP